MLRRGVEPVGLDFAPTADTVCRLPTAGSRRTTLVPRALRQRIRASRPRHPTRRRGIRRLSQRAHRGPGSPRDPYGARIGGPAVLAVAALLVVGVGVGWLLFGRSAATPVALSAQQQEWQSALIAGGRYDPGSVRALAVRAGGGHLSGDQGRRRDHQPARGDLRVWHLPPASARRPSRARGSSGRHSGVEGRHQARAQRAR